MNEPFLDFAWRVAPDHRWSDLVGQDGKKAVVPFKGLASLESPTGVELAWGRLELKGKGSGPVLRPSPSDEPRSYFPMQREHAPLFRMFAELDYHNREAIRAFANTYGMLGVHSDHYYGESQLTWAREICLMRDALDLTRAATPASERRERMIWRKYDEQIRDFQSAQGNEIDPSESRHQERRHRLSWLFNSHLQHVQCRMAFDSDVPPRLSFQPLTLLAAMWLQMALDVIGDKSFPACKFCRRLFEISTEQTGFRSHREFCSGACKTKHYRRRKRTARQLAGKGKTLSEIAKATETDIDTVRAWAGSPKRVVKAERKTSRRAT